MTDERSNGGSASGEMQGSTVGRGIVPGALNEKAAPTAAMSPQQPSLPNVFGVGTQQPLVGDSIEPSKAIQTHAIPSAPSKQGLSTIPQGAVPMAIPKVATAPAATATTQGVPAPFASNFALLAPTILANGVSTAVAEAPSSSCASSMATLANPQLLWQQALQTFNQAQQQQILAQASSLMNGSSPALSLQPQLNLAGIPASLLPQLQPALPIATPTTTGIAPNLTPVVQDVNQPQKRKANSSDPQSQEQHAKRSRTTTAPSVVSSYSGSIASEPTGPPTSLSKAALDGMSAAERRRYERNLREQQRSYKISQQIKELRDVLTESKVPFKPNKFSILVSVGEYIQELQRRAIMLDANHQRLIDTIKQTNELVSSGQVPSSSLSSSETEESSSDNNKDLTTTQLSSSEVSPDFLLVHGINYEAVFKHCPYALGVTTLDGRILACNPAFERVLGCSSGELASQSLFLHIKNHQEVFEAMADMLKNSSLASETGEGTVKRSHLYYWCGQVVSAQQLEVRRT